MTMIQRRAYSLRQLSHQNWSFKIIIKSLGKIRMILSLHLIPPQTVSKKSCLHSPSINVLVWYLQWIKTIFFEHKLSICQAIPSRWIYTVTFFVSISALDGKRLRRVRSLIRRLLGLPEMWATCLIDYYVEWSIEVWCAAVSIFYSQNFTGESLVRSAPICTSELSQHLANIVRCYKYSRG